MLNVYKNISAVNGPHVAGICKIFIAPIEWLAADVVKDFKTGRIIQAVEFIDGKNFLELQLIFESYDYSEKPKVTKQGTFFEISLTATTNSLDADILQTLNTYRYHQFVVLLQDKQKRRKLAGNQDAGMVMQFANKETTATGGNQVVTLDFNIDLEYPAPFYPSEDDGTFVLGYDNYYLDADDTNDILLGVNNGNYSAIPIFDNSFDATFN